VWDTARDTPWESNATDGGGGTGSFIIIILFYLIIEDIGINYTIMNKCNLYTLYFINIKTFSKRLEFICYSSINMIDIIFDSLFIIIMYRKILSQKSLI